MMNYTYTKQIRFNNSLHADFAGELRRRVNDYFIENKISRFANTEMKIRGLLMFGLLLTPYFLLLFFQFPLYQMILLGALSGIGMAGVGFNISHDACHNAYSRNARTNRLLGHTFNFVGISAYLWKIKHNLSHHTYTNIYHKDEDLLESKDVRLSPDAPYKPIHRFQHIYYFMFYPLYSFLWITVYDFHIFFRYNGNGSSDPNKKHPLPEVAIFVGTKIFYLVFALLVPFYFIQAKWWEVLICYMSMHAVAGVILACVAKMGHIVDNVSHFMPDENGVINNSWMVHELHTTCNFSMNNRLITWYTGGLNFQIEHHLFPGVCNVHYKNISPIVQEITAKYQHPYHVNMNMLAGLKSHYRVLKRYGRPEPNMLEAS